MRDRDDEALTAWALAAGGGDAEAVDRFIRATRTDVWRYVSRLSDDPQSADDLVQETYLRALRGLPNFEARSSARTWLLSIARRAVVDRLRWNAARPRLSDTDDWQSVAERTQARALPQLGFDEGVALSQLLALLPYERREAFVLTQLLGLPYAEAAVVAGCPVGTVRSRVARAREALIAQLTTAERDASDGPGALAASVTPGAPGAPGAPGLVATPGTTAKVAGGGIAAAAGRCDRVPALAGSR
ncbi:sigma-70 family RNA polymerase sigma factor [Streptomyces sp. XD-27]|uniref:sigma-70 family RNA polymerase sigma factor n=1 Tax=Streptomyces sp. XD-27 TaxID=3062779 RepID=UPI0026F457A1|nr:sigma-70 family RNA polymerase sigma factor [Streptomyces sp. XD-27]WKX73513.1 sigma-70 family RNA polymerase sigma factor [Streptomyces sp. XD-27]